MLELPEADSAKEERFRLVAEAVVAVLLREGPTNLRYAAIARRAGVSRAWIYKNFGTEPDALLDFAVRLFGDAFAELGRSNASEDPAEWRANVMAATRRGFDVTVKAPWCLEVWHRFRHTPGQLGGSVRDLMERHFDKFVADMPPRLRRRPGARVLAEVFSTARLGVYDHWMDPRVRERTDVDALCAPLAGMLDAFVASEG